MLGRLKLVIVAAAAALILAPAMGAAQQDGGRFVVMIPYFQPLDGARKNFGEDASEELRDLMNTLVTHQAMDKDDIEDAADEYDRDMEELDCLTTIQLASALGVPVAICATYTEDAQRNYTVNATIRTIEDGEEFVLDEFTVPRGMRTRRPRRPSSNSSIAITIRCARRRSAASTPRASSGRTRSASATRPSRSIRTPPALASCALRSCASSIGTRSRSRK